MDGIQQPAGAARSVRISTPRDLDEAIGRGIKARRITLGMSQSMLAELAGIRFQQIYKYERALNRISASRLWQIAVALRVPIGWFFEEARAPIAHEPVRADLEMMSAVSNMSEADRQAVYALIRHFRKEGADDQRSVP